MKTRRKNGFALLIILAAIVIMLLLYFIQANTLFQPSVPAKPVEIEKRPWAYENLLVPPEKTVKKPKAPKPLLTEEFQVSGPAERNGQPRGQIKITFDADGRIRAVWETDYAADGKTHAITAQMNGNVSTKMAFENDSGTDKTRLFFIATGPYEHQTTAADSAAYASNEKGTAWLTGWLMPDRTAKGFVTITTDLKWSMEFAFKAEPAK